MRLALLLALFSSVLVSSAQCVCLEPQPRLVCAEYFASTLVVEATLTQGKAIYDKHEPSYRTADVYTLRVVRVLRGEPTENISIYEGNDSGRATFGWTPGKKYLLFLFRSPSARFWELDGCGNSGPLDRAGKTLARIEAIDTNSPYGTIYGVVRGGDPSRGVQIKAHGSLGHYNAITNQNGQFHMRVLAGNYTVRAVQKGFTFEVFDLSYSDPRKIQIEPGSCVQIELISSR